FYNAHDYEGLMQAIEADRCASVDSGNKDRLLCYWKECPQDIRIKYPRAALSCATRLFTLGERNLASLICTEISETILNDLSLSTEERNQILGECEMVLGSADFNNLQSASQRFHRATQLMSRPSGLLNVCDTATFGSPSLLCLFHCKVGKLDETLDYFKNVLPFYLEVTGESDIGEEYILEAESLFLRGELDSAEIALNKALYICEQRPKRGFLIIALFTACRIALMRGDYPLISSLMERMCIAASEASARLFYHTVDAAKAWIYSLLGLPDLIPDWIRNGELNKSHLLAPALSTLHMIHGQVMLSKREYTRLISMSELYLETTNTYSNLLAAIYLHIQTAAAHAALHQRRSAEEHLRIALSMAMPDQLYVPFAVNFDYFAKELRSASYPHYIAELEQIIKLNKVFRNGKDSIIKRYFGGYGNNLTKREYQVAQLAAQGMTNREIAETLYVSSETVKTQMKGVLQKLGLNSRAQLKDYPLEQFAPKQL
ncbi:MAG: helix-turn-helix transcriptional regulator, partial [Peptococcaceae bacterium]|nr:helix-turn-helix transcriptional regulator [Peptococcaceae bacterium]